MRKTTETALGLWFAIEISTEIISAFIYTNTHYYGGTCDSYICVCFLFAGVGVSAGPGPLPTQTALPYGMQRAPVPSSSIGHPAQFLPSVGSVPQASYSDQAVPVGVNYPQEVPRESLAPYVPLPHFREPGVF